MQPREDQHRPPAFARRFAIDPAELDRSFQITRTFEDPCGAKSKHQFWTGVITGTGLCFGITSLTAVIGPNAWTLPLGIVAAGNGIVLLGSLIASGQRDPDKVCRQYPTTDAKPRGFWTPQTSFAVPQDMVGSPRFVSLADHPDVGSGDLPFVPTPEKAPGTAPASAPAGQHSASAPALQPDPRNTERSRARRRQQANSDPTPRQGE